MIPAQLHVLADDLTGAAEIAALGFRHGLRATVIPAAAARAATCAAAGEPELIVCDTDSRLDPPAIAAGKVSDTLARLGLGARSWCYKKTDSVLRGPVTAELKAFADFLQRARVLLVPCNPSLGRTIRGGEYFIGGVPLDRTPFARDPHHPARSAQVAVMLEPLANFPVTVAPAATALPARGLAVGEAQSIADLDRWAAQVDAMTAAAGGAEFFSANLRALGFRLQPAMAGAALPAPTLVISGTASPESRARLKDVAQRGIALLPQPEVTLDSGPACDAWLSELTRALEQRALAITTAPETHAAGEFAASVIRERFATSASQLHARGLLRHLVIEGGATAAAVLAALGMAELEVVHEWAQGVITLRPARQPDLRVTLKPGSYAWPAGWWAQLPHSPFS